MFTSRPLSRVAPIQSDKLHQMPWNAGCGIWQHSDRHTALPSIGTVPLRSVASHCFRFSAPTSTLIKYSLHNEKAFRFYDRTSNCPISAGCKLTGLNLPKCWSIMLACSLPAPELYWKQFISTVIVSLVMLGLSEFQSRRLESIASTVKIEDFGSDFVLAVIHCCVELR